MFSFAKEMKQTDADLHPSLNFGAKYERTSRPASEFMFSGYNKRNTYSNESIRVGNYDRDLTGINSNTFSYFKNLFAGSLGFKTALFMY